MNLDVMGSLEGQVGLLGACTANQYSFLTGLSRAILDALNGAGALRTPYGLMVLFGRLVEKSLSF